MRSSSVGWNFVWGDFLMWPSTCLGDVSPVLRRPAFVSPRVASVRLHLLSPCRLVRSKHIQKKMLRSTAPCYIHTKLLMIRQTRTINGLSLCSCLLKEQVQERLNSPDLQSNVVLRNLRCMATHVSGGVYIYINDQALVVPAYLLYSALRKKTIRLLLENRTKCQFRPFPPQGKTQTRETGWREDRND